MRSFFMRVGLLSVGLVTAAGTGSTASAAVITAVGTSQDGGTAPTLTHTFVPSSTDLLNGLTPVATGNFTLEGTGGVPVLTDGTIPSTITRSTPVFLEVGAYATAGPTAGTSLTYTFPSRMNLTALDIYSGWQDRGRDAQNYTVSYSTGFGYSTLVNNYTFNPTVADGTTPVANRVNITNSAGFIASNVTSLRFTFNGVENNYTGYSEIDAFGTASSIFNAGKIGAGSALAGPNSTDTAGGARLNIDLQNALNLSAGTYNVNDISFAADAGNGTGNVRVFLLRETGDNIYETLWLSDANNPTTNGVFTDTTFANAQFTLGADSVVFAGIYHDGIARVYYNDTATLLNHDAAGVISPNLVGDVVSDISNLGLNNRTYKFEANVSPVAVPEPSTLVFMGMGFLGLLGLSRRGKKLTSE